MFQELKVQTKHPWHLHLHLHHQVSYFQTHLWTDHHLRHLGEELQFDYFQIELRNYLSCQIHDIHIHHLVAMYFHQSQKMEQVLAILLHHQIQI
jgi:hypothetical protein